MKRSCKVPALTFAGPQSALFGADFMARLATNPATRAYVQQPDFLQMIHDCGVNPQNMSM